MHQKLKRRVKGRPCPWIINEIADCMNKSVQLPRKVEKSGRQEHCKIYKKKRNGCTKIIRKVILINNFSKRIPGTRVISGNTSKKLFQTNQRTNPRTLYHLSSLLSEILWSQKLKFSVSFFSKIAKSLKEKAFPLKNTVWNCNALRKLRTTATFKFDYVSVAFVQSELKKIKKNKAAGLDELPGVLIKYSASVISKLSLSLLNLSLKTPQVPRDWKIMQITPIFKSGVSTNTYNYRPISMLPIISKVLEKTVYTQVMNYLEKYNLLSSSQFGYRKKRNTRLATTLLLDSFHKSLNDGMFVGCNFLNLSKAFDMISHSVLL